MTLDPALLKTQAYIGGEWRSARNAGGENTGVKNAAKEKTFAVTNPADGSVLAHVADCTPRDADDAVRAACLAFPAWKAALPKTRADALKRWFRLITDNTDALAAILSAEQGKPLAEAKAEITYGAAFVEWFAEEARRIYGRTIPPFREHTSVVVTREPVGVCTAITPWNFPHSMITRKVSPAIAVGCTIVLKPAADTPLSALALAALAEQAGIPKGVFNVVPSTDAQGVGLVLSTHPDVAKLSFTGSTAIGRLLTAQAAPGLKHISMELGGNAPFIVFDDADLESAVKGAISSKFRNSGQTCVCANRFYIQRKIYPEFARAFTQATQALNVGAAHEKNVTIGPLINKAAITKVERLLADALTRGAKVLTGGRAHPRGGLFFEPTVLGDATSAMALALEEIFGPVAPLFPFDTEEEALSAANASEHGLAAYVYTNDLGRAFRMSENLQFGMVGINEGVVSSEVAPFGGVKQSGYGREGAVEGAEAYLNTKYTLIGGL